MSPEPEEQREDLRELTTLDSIAPSRYRSMREWYLHELGWADAGEDE